MKNKLMIMLILCTTPCFAEENTLYSENGVSLSYSYEKIGTIKDQDCPNLLFDEYQAIAKVKNSNNKAIKLDNNSWLVPRIAFVGYTCNKLGELTSEENNYFAGFFMDHRYYGTHTPNTGFGAVHTYFLDPNDTFTSQPSIIRVPNGEPLAKPAWFFPEWKFIDVPNQNGSTNTDTTPPKLTNVSTDFSKLIVGKWRFSQSSELKNGKEIEVYNEEDACFDNYQANNRVVINIGDCNNAEKSGKWIIAGNKLTTNTDGDVTNYEILRLDKSTLKLKSMVEHNVGSYFISTFEKVSK